MQIDIYTHPSCFKQLESDWNDLLLRVPSHTIFSTWEWVSTWWESYEPGNLWVIACRTNNQLIGIVPCFIDNMGVVRGIGCEDVTDYFDLIIDPQYLGAVLHSIVEVLVNNKSKFSKLQLCNFSETSLVLQQFPKTLADFGFDTRIEQQEVCPIITLPSSWDDYLALLPKKQRHEVRRKLRRSEGSDVSIDWYTVGNSHDIDVEVDKFLHLMAISDQRKSDFLEDEKNLKFFKKITSLTHKMSWLQLNFLEIDGKPVAAYLNFTYGNHVLVYNSGLDISEFGYLSPGIVLLAYNIRYAIERGYQIFDFLRGDETYKYRMGGQDTSVYQVTVQFNG